jgi:hypothetical protein
MSANKFQWQFTVVERNTDEEEPMGGEFFVNSESLTNVSLLVREAVQNSIDAVLDKSKPVRMRFFVGKIDQTKHQKYMNTLVPHIDVALDKPLADIKPEDLTYLIVEDFNTKGLKGNTTSKRPVADPAEKDKDSFYFFEWKTGESNKDSGTGGKWGVGKVVFSFVSHIKTYLVFSSRQKESAPAGNTNLFFGHNVMKCHDLDNNERCKAKHRLMKTDEAGNQIPFDEPEIIEKFTSEWQVKRKLEEPGTSIVVPYCFAEFNAQTILQCLAQDYFIAFLDGGLECEVSDYLSDEVIVLNRETLLDNIRELPENLRTDASKSRDELLSLCALYLSKEDPSTTQINIGVSSAKANSWNDLEIDQEKLDDLTATLESFKPVVVNVDVKIPVRESKEYEIDTFQVLFQKRDKTRLRTTFCRHGILIPDASKSLTIPSNYVTLVYVPKGAFADMLGVAEDPSHKSWTSKQEKFKKFYKPEKFSHDCISYIRDAANRIISASQNASAEKDSTSLSKFFPIVNSGIVVDPQTNVPRVILTKSVDKLDKTKVLLEWTVENFVSTKTELIRKLPSSMSVFLDNKKKSENVTIDSFTETFEYLIRVSNDTSSVESNVVRIAPSVPKGSKVLILPLSDGFQVSNLDKKSVKIGDEIEVIAAYDQREGSGFQSWSAEDFKIDQMLDTSSLKSLTASCTNNKAVLTVLDKDFEATFRGFDAYRDLIVEAKVTRSDD